MSSARIFISCGQKFDDEINIASQISRRLRSLGFDVYVAKENQTLKGIKENIFPRLEEAEYFIFIDFKREKLDDGKWRGSLFSHQELALAAFLEKDVLSYQEIGVRNDDGILGTLQANSILFSDRKSLPDNIANRITYQLNWDSNWRNEISIERDIHEFEDGILVSTGIRRRWYHLKLVNKHRNKIAFECMVYLRQCKNLLTGKTTVFSPVELKWKGLNTIRSIVPPQNFKLFDAFYVPNDEPNIVYFGINYSIVDFTGIRDEYKLIGPGKFELDFVVFSLNFEPTNQLIFLEIGTKIDDIKFYSN